MICFGAETKRNEKKRTYGFHTNKKKKRKRIRREEREADREGNVFIFIFIFFSSLTSLFDLRKSDSQNSSGQEAK